MVTDVDVFGYPFLPNKLKINPSVVDLKKNSEKSNLPASFLKDINFDEDSYCGFPIYLST